MRHIDADGSTGRSPHRPVQSVTSAPQSAADDQGARMRRYLTAMGLRTVCFVLAIVASGWLRWGFVAGAVILPYVAVVLANAVGPRFGQAVSPVMPVEDERLALTGVIEDPDGYPRPEEQPGRGGPRRG